MGVKRTPREVKNTVEIISNTSNNFHTIFVEGQEFFIGSTISKYVLMRLLNLFGINVVDSSISDQAMEEWRLEQIETNKNDESIDYKDKEDKE